MKAPSVWFKELRAEFLPASVLPVLLGTALAYYEERMFNGYTFILTLLGVVFLHLGTNTANDYYDHISGNDAVNRDFVRPFTGGSRLIQEGLISPKGVLFMSLSLFSAAIVVGALLILERGIPVLLLGIVGIASGFFYTAPPFRFGYRGFGEPLIGLNFGILITCGAYYVQAGHIAVSPLLASLPLAFLISSVVFINEFQDAKADAEVGKKTLVVRLGKRRAVMLLAVLSPVGFLSVVAGAAAGILPPLTLISLAALVPLARAIRIARANYMKNVELAPANASVIMSHTAAGILMAIGTVLSF